MDAKKATRHQPAASQPHGRCHAEGQPEEKLDKNLAEHVALVSPYRR
jgi:hypothetical protein